MALCLAILENDQFLLYPSWVICNIYERIDKSQITPRHKVLGSFPLASSITGIQVSMSVGHLHLHVCDQDR